MTRHDIKQHYETDRPFTLMMNFSGDSQNCEERLLASSCLSVSSHGTQLPLDGFSWNLNFEYFPNICPEISSFNKIIQEIRVLYMKTKMQLSLYLAHYLECKMFQTEVIERKKTHVLCSVAIFLNRTVYETMWKNTVEPDSPQMTIWRMRIACWIPKATNTHSSYVILIVFPL
jgi:hypothetical protein